MKKRILSILSLTLTCAMLLGLGAALPLSVSAASPTLVNIFNVSTAENGHYHPVTNNKMSSNFCTNTAAVKEGDVITFGPSPISGQDFHIVVYDASGNIIQTDFNTPGVLTVADRTSFRNHYLYSYTVPAGAATIRFTVANDIKYVFTATKNRPFDVFDFYTYWNEDATRAATYLKSPRADSRQDGYSGQPFHVNEDSILKGRSVLFCGDSIVSAQRDTSLFYTGWADRIGKVNGMTYVNNGVSSTTFSTKSPYGTIESQLNVLAHKSFDYIITNGGINDAYFSAPVGVMTDSFEAEDFDTSTFAGGLEHFFYTAREKYPMALIGYICSHSTPMISTGYASDMTEYYAVAKEICEKWHVYCLDIYNNTDFCNNELKTSEKTYMDDNLHPNGAGTDMIYLLVEEWMKAIPHRDNPVDDPITDVDPDPVQKPTSTSPEASDTKKDTATDTSPSSGCGAAIAPMTAMLLTATAAGATVTLKKKKKS